MQFWFSCAMNGDDLARLPNLRRRVFPVREHLLGLGRGRPWRWRGRRDGRVDHLNDHRAYSLEPGTWAALWD